MKYLCQGGPLSGQEMKRSNGSNRIIMSQYEDCEQKVGDKSYLSSSLKKHSYIFHDEEWLYQGEVE